MNTSPTNTTTRAQGTPAPPRLSRPEDVEAVVVQLRGLLEADRTNEALHVVAQVLSMLLEKNTALELKVYKLLMQHRGNKGEGLTSSQLDLFLKLFKPTDEAERAKADEKLSAAATPVPPDPADETKAPKKPRQPAVRLDPPAHLRREENKVLVPAAQRPCPVCKGDRCCIGYDRCNVIDMRPAELFVRLDLLEKLACNRCDELTQAPPPPKLVPHGKLGFGLVSDLLVGKYRDGLPLHRQAQRYARLGVNFPSSTLADQPAWAADLLEPLWELEQQKVLASFLVQCDDTALRVLDRDHPAGIRSGALWAYIGDARHAVYLFTSTHHKEARREDQVGPETFLARHEGYVQCDGASVFDAGFKRGVLIEVGCHMHSRRKAVAALEAKDLRAALIVGVYKKIYDIEEELRPCDPDARRDARRQRIKPLLDTIYEWIHAHVAHEPPKTLMHEAMTYFVNQKVALYRFIDDGRLPIDNGLTERIHRRPALTRRNFLFAGSADGGRRAAILFSLLAGCELAGHDPVAYLTDVLTKCAGDWPASRLSELLPANWRPPSSAATTAAD